MLLYFFKEEKKVEQLVQILKSWPKNNLYIFILLFLFLFSLIDAIWKQNERVSILIFLQLPRKKKFSDKCKKTQKLVYYVR